MDAMETGRRVRAARAYAGFSQEALARRVGMGRGTLWKIEHGLREARPGELWEIARACQVPHHRMVEEWHYDGPERRGGP